MIQRIVFYKNGNNSNSTWSRKMVKLWKIISKRWLRHLLIFDELIDILTPICEFLLKFWKLSNFWQMWQNFKKYTSYQKNCCCHFLGNMILHNLTKFHFSVLFWTPGLSDGILSNRPSVRGPSVCSPSVFEYLIDRSLVFLKFRMKFGINKVKIVTRPEFW